MRIAFGSRYSSESYRRCAWATLENSRITIKGGGQGDGEPMKATQSAASLSRLGYTYVDHELLLKRAQRYGLAEDRLSHLADSQHFARLAELQQFLAELNVFTRAGPEERTGILPDLPGDLVRHRHLRCRAVAPA